MKAHYGVQIFLPKEEKPLKASLYASKSRAASNETSFLTRPTTSSKSDIFPRATPTSPNLTASKRIELLENAASMTFKHRRHFVAGDSSPEEEKTSSSAVSTPPSPRGSPLKYPLRERARRLSIQRKSKYLKSKSSVRSEESLIDAEDTKHGEDEGNLQSGGNINVTMKMYVRRPPCDPGDSMSDSSQLALAEGPPVMNDIKLHIYDLIAHDTLMQLPFGCLCEIGKCFNDVNSALHTLGTGAYHVGIEVNGIEYAFGATSAPGRSGVFSCPPKLSPGYQYRTTIDLGKRPLIKKTYVTVFNVDQEDRPLTSVVEKVEHVEGRTIIRQMSREYMGIDYDILRRNCCTFARDACLRLGVKDEEIPTWFRNLAESGAMTQDLVEATVAPIVSVFTLETVASPECEEKDEQDDGFEVQPNEKGEDTIVKSSELSKDEPVDFLTRMATWVY